MHLSELLCDVNRIEYDFDTKIGRVVTNFGCAHGPGVIALFVRLDPEVLRIEVFEAGEGLDATYTRKTPLREWRPALRRD